MSSQTAKAGRTHYSPFASLERFALPHPLSRFAANGTVKEGPCTDAILEFIHSLTWDEPERGLHKVAVWFLFDSEHAYFVVCAEAGIDAGKLRSHLRETSAMAF